MGLVQWMKHVFTAVIVVMFVVNGVFAQNEIELDGDDQMAVVAGQIWDALPYQKDATRQLLAAGEACQKNHAEVGTISDWTKNDYTAADAAQNVPASSKQTKLAKVLRALVPAAGTAPKLGQIKKQSYHVSQKADSLIFAAKTELNQGVLLASTDKVSAYFRPKITQTLSSSTKEYLRIVAMIYHEEEYTDCVSDITFSGYLLGDTFLEVGAWHCEKQGTNCKDSPFLAAHVPSADSRKQDPSLSWKKQTSLVETTDTDPESYVTLEFDKSKEFDTCAMYKSNKWETDILKTGCTSTYNEKTSRLVCHCKTFGIFAAAKRTAA